MPFQDPYLKELDQNVDSLLETPGDFTVEKDEGCVGRLILRTRGGTTAEVDLRSVIWGKDGPGHQGGLHMNIEDKRKAALRSSLAHYAFSSEMAGVSVNAHAWTMAFKAGEEFITKACQCGGLRRIEVPGYGWCRCPSCVPLVHLVAPQGILCKSDYKDMGTTDVVGDVTCSDCLQGLLNDYLACSVADCDNLTALRISRPCSDCCKVTDG